LFKLNNTDFIYKYLASLGLTKGISDIRDWEKAQQKCVEQYISILLHENFPGLEQVVTESYGSTADDSDSEE